MNDVGTSHPLHEYQARELAERLDSRRIVVVYDSRSELVPFFDRELPPAEETHVGASPLPRTGVGLPWRSCATTRPTRDWPASTAR